MREAGPLIFQNIHRTFAGVTALDGVSFEAALGSVTALIGPNGAGKTTMLNIANGHLGASKGRVYLGTRDITDLPAYHRARLGIARTFQRSRVFERMSVLDNLEIGSCAVKRSAGLFGRSRQARYRNALQRVGLVGYERRWATDLSHAEQRRLEIARALVSEPTVLLVDEPAAGLDGNERADLAELVRQLRDAGVCVLLVEHSVPFVLAVADLVVALDFGKVIASGEPRAVIGDAAVLNAYLGKHEAE